ncbi:serine/threonine protein kinase [Pyxidicoccus sp. MSG2]|uniref:serine/threonine protein kinase n=1 Tax=Pyxidicoccus sp. MSG2 TaxID=2996790 RepID=UPI00226EE9D8|nr:serine/threonine-protein kinase [Pyxidicoccus sp. MSG2]MCY1023398.1 serine/threonine-protein kinase [Pyxidicoccus sp. MSG2]
MESDELNPARLPPGTRVGPWRVLEQRGRGTYGVVYRAVPAEELAAEAVALKLALHPRDARFAREAELLSRIHHPAVPRLLDHGHWQPREGVTYAWLAMEWVEGLSLYEWAQAQRPTSRQVLQLLARLARALDATHSAGGLHRDVKGENVRVRRADGQPFLLDFGCGHHLGAATLTPKPFPPGTPAYRSPEAWRFALGSSKPPARLPAVAYPPGPADDVFALGVTAYRLVTEKYPPSAHPWEEEEWRWSPEELESWTARVSNPRCTAELSALVSRMLSPRPEERGSAREVAEALEKAARRAGREAEVPLFKGEEPRPAGLIPIPRRVAVLPPPRMRRWPWLAAAGLGGALALSAGGLLSVSHSEEPATSHVAEQEESKDAGTVAVGDSVLTAPVAPERAPSVWASIAVELPPKPIPGQRRPDGKGHCPGKVHVAINGGCWRKVPVELKECDDWDGFEYKGECYQPVLTPTRPSTSGPAERDDSP